MRAVGKGYRRAVPPGSDSVWNIPLIAEKSASVSRRHHIRFVIDSFR